MNNKIINGINPLDAGEYDSIEINGGAKSAGVVKSKKIIVDGLLNSRGILEVGYFVINGRVTSKGDIISDKIIVNGMLQINEKDIKVRELICKGTIQSLGSVFGDNVEIDGLCNINNIQAKTLTLKTDYERISHVEGVGGVGKIFSQLCNVERCTLNSIECDEIKAEDCYINFLKATDIELVNNCIVNKIYCKGNISIDNSCKVGDVVHLDEEGNIILQGEGKCNETVPLGEKIINGVIIGAIKEIDTIDINKGEYNDVREILISYKQNEISMEETEKAIQNCMERSIR